MSWEGGCQCGAVRYRIAADDLTVYACHCRECQKQSASAFGLSVPVTEAQFDLTGMTASWRLATDSGTHTRCFFCPTCGGRVYHANESRPGMVTVKGGSFDRAGELAPVAHIWTASKVDWLTLPEDFPKWRTQPQTHEQGMELLGWAN